MLGHDLMSPHLPLHDQAQVFSCEPSGKYPDVGPKDRTGRAIPQSSQEFMSYVDHLLSGSRHDSSQGHPCQRPSKTPGQSPGWGKAVSAREAIDLAILQSNVALPSSRSTNRYEIARNGQPVAVIMLTRSAYRLGEVVTAVADFRGARIPCYSISWTLESSEMVNPALALRSRSSIERVTRRIYTFQMENTLFARRVIFNPPVPFTATPSFRTSGVSLEWRLRIRFVTPELTDGDAESDSGGYALLKDVNRDDRGSVKAAVESLTCTSFEVLVPLTIYGAAAGPTDHGDARGLPL